MHQLDDQSTDKERASRRLQEWVEALVETQKLREGIVKASHPKAGTLPDESVMRAQLTERALGIGLAVSGEGKRLLVGGHRRLDRMKLAELYLAGDGGGGVPSVLMRRHAAAAHGYETALLGSVSDTPGPGGLNLLTPRPLETRLLTFELMGVPLAICNAVGLLARRFGWRDLKEYDIAGREQDRALAVWKAAMTSHLNDVARERPRTGLVTARLFDPVPVLGTGS